MRELTIDEAFKGNYLFIDVRSEAEFAESTIPGAINLPLFDNLERASVGTVYKQQSEQAAKFLGLEIVSHKLPYLMGEINTYIQNQHKVVLFCWRGGMRSKSLALMAGFMGLSVYRLVGGYKAYRKHVNHYFENLAELPLVVLHGNTGVGKTDLIELMRQEDLPAIDLEGLANNRGSVFGDISMPPQPSQKMFESLLFNELHRFKDAKAIIVECESKRIGRLVLPEQFFMQMQAGKHVLAYSSVEKRVERLVDIYGESDSEIVDKLISAITSLRKRLGTQEVDYLLKLVNLKALDQAALILLTDYYDPLYGYPNEPGDAYDLCINTDDIKTASETLAKELGLRR